MRRILSRYLSIGHRRSSSVVAAHVCWKVAPLQPENVDAPEVHLGTGAPGRQDDENEDRGGHDRAPPRVPSSRHAMHPEEAGAPEPNENPAAK